MYTRNEGIQNETRKCIHVQHLMQIHVYTYMYIYMYTMNMYIYMYICQLCTLPICQPSNNASNSSTTANFPVSLTYTGSESTPCMAITSLAQHTCTHHKHTCTLAQTFSNQYQQHKPPKPPGVYIYIYI